MTSTLIGHTGTVGQTLQDQHQFDFCYSSHNIIEFPNMAHDFVVCAAPSGDRRLINTNPEADNQDIKLLIQILSQSSIQHMVLISSTDSINFPNTPYGHNRLKLENFILNHVPKSHVVRLGALIGQHIKKNILYDLKHQVHLEHIDLQTTLQWYNLQNLWADIQTVIQGSVQTHNFVGEPIVNKEIIARFFPQYQTVLTKQPEVSNIQPYWINRQQIFAAIEAYLL
jgi:hypothetical protein